MTTLWLPLQKQLILVHIFISFLRSTTSKSSILPITFTSISAFTVQQEQQRQQQRHRSLSSVVARQSSTLLEHSLSHSVFFRYRYFQTPIPSSTRIMTHSTLNEESIHDDNVPLLRSQRPELVLSLKKYIQEFNSATNSDKNDSQDSTATIKLILASASPRRREILDMMGLQHRYEVIPSPLDETKLQNRLRSSDHLDPYLYTRTLAQQKAYAVAYDMLSQQSISSEQNQRLILGSDTVVAITDDCTNVTTILEKPVDTNDAIRMLQQLQNKTHIVYTGVAIVRYTPLASSIESESTIPKDSTDTVDDGYFRDDSRQAIQLVQSFVETAVVHISALNDIDIKSYVATTEPMDKAGAYGIQGIGGQIVTKVDGDFFTVMGLPMHQTSRSLASAILDIVDHV